MPNPDVKAVRAALEEAKPLGDYCKVTWAVVTHGLKVCDSLVAIAEAHQHYKIRCPRCLQENAKLDLIASILANANLLPKEGA